MNSYTDKLKKHYETYYGFEGNVIKWDKGPIEKLHQDFYILEFMPNKRYKMWTYATVGMSLDRTDENLIETILYSPRQDNRIVELLTMNSSFHRNSEPLNLHHTVYFGEPWLDNSNCDHGYLSLPYLDGEYLELFNYQDKIYHCYWLIPITKKERDFKFENGCEALEQLFESRQFDYIDINRKCLIKNKKRLLVQCIHNGGFRAICKFISR